MIFEIAISTVEEKGQAVHTKENKGRRVGSESMKGNVQTSAPGTIQPIPITEGVAFRATLPAHGVRGPPPEVYAIGRTKPGADAGRCFGVNAVPMIGS